MSKSTTTTDATPAATGDSVVSTVDVVTPSVTPEPVVTPALMPALEKPQPVPPSEPAPQLFTQADLERIVKERLKHERDKYADYGDLKLRSEKLDQLEREYEQTKTSVDSAKNEAERAKLEAAVVAAAARLGFADPNDAVKLVGATKADEVEGALKGLLEQKPYLARKNAPPLNAANPSRDDAQPAGRTDADRRADYFGGGAGSFWQGRGSTVSTRGQD